MSEKAREILSKHFDTIEHLTFEKKNYPAIINTILLAMEEYDNYKNELAKDLTNAVINIGNDIKAKIDERKLSRPSAEVKSEPSPMVGEANLVCDCGKCELYTGFEGGDPRCRFSHRKIPSDFTITATNEFKSDSKNIEAITEMCNLAVKQVGEVSEEEKKLQQEKNELWKMLDDINAVMWNSFMIKDRKFTEKDGEKIMTILEKWAFKY